MRTIGATRPARYFHGMRIRLLSGVLGILVSLSLVGLSGCERPRAPVNGIGGFELAKTTLGSVENQAIGRCFDSQERTNCIIMARQTIAKRTPQIQLEFAGTKASSVLRRIFLDIPGCDLDETRTWFEERMGAPSNKSEKGALWRQKHIVLSLIAGGPARCSVTAADPVDDPNVALLLRAHGLEPEPKDPSATP